jgi:uncharacterized protein (TIGR03435 family)
MEKLLVATTGLLAILVPVEMLNARQLGTQVTNASQPSFEVASVKRNNSGDPRTMVQMAPGRMTIANVPAHVLIESAYRIQGYQVLGGPSWLNSDRFDIVAKVESNQAPEQVALMIRALLVDRFKLMVHTEKRELPIYTLVMAKNDGKLGAKLRPVATDCAAVLGRGNGSPAIPQPGERMPCGLRVIPGSIAAAGIPLAFVADSLARFVNRVVTDRTGLSGYFDVELEWAPDQLTQPPGVDVSPTSDPNGPSLFTALQEQLGLKLESTKGPVDVVVVDNVEQPTPD